MKLNKTSIAALIFIVIMVGSTIAFTFIQAAQFGLGGGQTQVKLPDSNNIDYALSLDQEQLALSQGKTIIKYSYPPTCTQCLSVASQLDGVASQFSDQVILEKLSSPVANVTSVLTFASAQNSKIYNDPSINNIIDGICAVLVKPPIDCTLRNFNSTLK